MRYGCGTSATLMFRISFWGDHQRVHRSSINLLPTAEHDGRLPDRPSVLDGLHWNARTVDNPPLRFRDSCL